MTDRGEIAIIDRLMREPGWYDGLPSGTRRRVMDRLLETLDLKEVKPRTLIAIARVLSQLERNDIEKAKLLKEFVPEEDPEDVGDDDDHDDETPPIK